MDASERARPGWLTACKQSTSVGLGTVKETDFFVSSLAENADKLFREITSSRAHTRTLFRGLKLMNNFSSQRWDQQFPARLQLEQITSQAWMKPIHVRKGFVSYVAPFKVHVSEACTRPGKSAVTFPLLFQHNADICDLNDEAKMRPVGVSGTFWILANVEWREATT